MPALPFLCSRMTTALTGTLQSPLSGKQDAAFWEVSLCVPCMSRWPLHWVPGKQLHVLHLQEPQFF